MVAPTTSLKGEDDQYWGSPYCSLPKLSKMLPCFAEAMVIPGVFLLLGSLIKGGHLVAERNMDQPPKGEAKAKQTPSTPSLASQEAYAEFAWALVRLPGRLGLAQTAGTLLSFFWKVPRANQLTSLCGREICLEVEYCSRSPSGHIRESSLKKLS